ncbi:MAG: hypothetical protein HQM15_09565, partial [Deltaproteobacteria bacterium]|nr:hypothetical protein [Deltaproteobacteria bacterium]
ALKTCRNFKYGTSDGNLPNESNADFNRTHDEGPKDVDAVPVSPLRIRMNGVLEWCNGWYRDSLEGLAKTTAGFLNPEIINEHVIRRELRGVSWDDDFVGDVRAANRNNFKPVARFNNFGFRAVVMP